MSEQQPEKPAAAKPAAPEAKAPETPLEPGPVGRWLSQQGVGCKPLPDSCGVETLEVDGRQLEKTMNLLRGNQQQFNYLVSVSGVDSADTWDSVYHLRSFFEHKELVVKVRVPKADVPEGQLPMVESLSNMWQAANWHERETYDLVGIRYINHPYLRRILNPWDWEGHPLRRDYKQPVDALNDKAPGSMR